MIKLSTKVGYGCRAEGLFYVLNFKVDGIKRIDGTTPLANHLNPLIEDRQLASVLIHMTPASDLWLPVLDSLQTPEANQPPVIPLTASLSDKAGSDNSDEYGSDNSDESRSEKNDTSLRHKSENWFLVNLPPPLQLTRYAGQWVPMTCIPR